MGLTHHNTTIRGRWECPLFHKPLPGVIHHPSSIIHSTTPSIYTYIYIHIYIPTLATTLNSSRLPVSRLSAMASKKRFWSFGTMELCVLCCVV